MKRLISYATIALVTTASFARTYNMTVTKTDGSVMIIPTAQIDKIEFTESGDATGHADLLDIVFNADGTATDMSPYKHAVITNKGAGLTTYYSDVHTRYVANFTHTPGTTVTDGYYRIKYSSDGDFIKRIADGCTFESIIKLGSSDDPTKEVKWFSSMQKGGIGFVLPKHDASNPGTKSLTFLPNVSPSGSSDWRWTYSNVVPEVGKYYHVVGVWDKDTGKSYIYVNGKLCGTADAPGNYVPVASGAESFLIGGDPDTKQINCTAAWNGEIASVRIHDKAMGTSEVQELWNSVAFDVDAVYASISNLQFLPECEVGAGYKLTFYGDGFKDGDSLIFTSDNGNRSYTMTTHVEEGSASVTIPAGMTSADYKVSLSRGNAKASMCSVKIKYSDSPMSPKKPKIIAHRGDHTGGAAENSLAALNRAMDAGYDGVELDIWLTKDKKLVVHHDGKANNITFQNANLSDLSGIKLSNGESLPTFDDFIAAFKAKTSDSPTKLIIEIKSHSTEALTKEAAEYAMNAVQQAGISDKVEYIAFNYATCCHISEKQPDAIVGYLNGDKAPKIVQQAGIKSIDYKMTVYAANPTWLREALDCGLKVNVWTVNSAGEMLKYIGQGADYITTDDPAGLKQLVSKTFISK